MIDKFAANILIVLILIGSFYLSAVMVNSLISYQMSKDCFQSGGIPVVVSNYVHCYE